MKTISGLLFVVLTTGPVLAQEKPAGTNAAPFHVAGADEFCRLGWPVSVHPLPRDWEKLDPVKVRGFLNACMLHDSERREADLTRTASVVGGKLFFYGSPSQQAAVTELVTALGGYDCDGFAITKPSQILWPVPLTIPAEKRPAYRLPPNRLKVEELLDAEMASVVALDSVPKILSCQKHPRPVRVAIHPSLKEKPCGTTSGMDITLRLCLDGYARGIGGRLAVRAGAVVIEPWPQINRKDWPDFPAVVRSYPLRLPAGMTTADVERLLSDMVAFMDGKEYAALVLPDRVVALTLDTFESHPMIENLLEKLAETNADSNKPHKGTK